jgi:hypothetical protein
LPIVEIVQQPAKVAEADQLVGGIQQASMTLIEAVEGKNCLTRPNFIWLK